MLLLYGVVHGELAAKLLKCGEELLDGHAGGPLVGFASLVDGVPGVAKMIVKIIHMLRHGIIDPELCRCKLGKGCLCRLRRGWTVGRHGCVMMDRCNVVEAADRGCCKGEDTLWRTTLGNNSVQRLFGAGKAHEATQ